MKIAFYITILLTYDYFTNIQIFIRIIALGFNGYV